MSEPAPGHHQVWSLLPAYALDAVDGSERDLVRDHVAACAVCGEQLPLLAGAVARLDSAHQPPPAHVWETIRRRTRAARLFDADASTGSGGGSTQRRRAQPGAGPVAVREAQSATAVVADEADVLRVIHDVTHRLLWSESPADAVAAVVELIERLGGEVIPAGHKDVNTLPVDVSFGEGGPMLPAAPLYSIARVRLEQVLPGVVEDARRAVTLARERSRRVR